MNGRFVVSDAGIDDLVALAVLSRLTSGTRHRVASTFGNVVQDLTALNVCEFITLSGEPWSHLDGAGLPLSGIVEHPWPDYFHGSDGVWNVHHVSESQVFPATKDEPRYSNAISLAPMTELLRSAQSGVTKRVTAMVGAFDVEGNETDYAETNLAFDPDAAHEFFRNCSDLDVRVVPLDVTRRVTWSREAIESAQCVTADQLWIKEVLLTWYAKYDHSREEVFCLHDPLAVYLDYFPDCATWMRTGIDVILDGEERGRTVRSSVNPVCRVAMEIDEPQKLARRLLDLVFATDIENKSDAQPKL